MKVYRSVLEDQTTLFLPTASQPFHTPLSILLLLIFHFFHSSLQSLSLLFLHFSIFSPLRYRVITPFLSSIFRPPFHRFFVPCSLPRSLINISLFSDRVGLPQPLTQCLVPAPPPWHSICALHLHLSSSPSTGILQSNRRALVPPSATLRVFFTYLHYFIPQSFTINRTRYNIADVYKSYPRHSF